MIYNYFIRSVFARSIIFELLKSSPHPILILFTKKQARSVLAYKISKQRNMEKTLWKLDNEKNHC